LGSNYTLFDLPGEEVLQYQGSSWQYMSKHFNEGGVQHIYYHVLCDSVVDSKGECVICGANSPNSKYL